MTNKGIKIEGSVAPGFESVKTLFEKEMRTKAEDSAQLCVYHQGEKVVDLWASKHAGFSPDSLINIFSSGKTLETLALAHLVDKGLLKYDAKIADYWPEFAANGKGDITVADLMRHEAGLVDFNHTFDPEHLLTENLKQNSAGSVIESLRAKISGNPLNRRNYHALTRGWVANELFRRVEPSGRSLGEFVRENLAEPLHADVYVGLKDQELERRAMLYSPSMLFQFLESFKPKFLGRKVAYSIGHLIALFAPIVVRIIGILLKNRKKKKTVHLQTNSENKSSEQKNKKGPRMPLKGFNPVRDREASIKFFNNPVIARGESSSFNANCSARGLAKVAAMMAAGGTWEGKTYFGEAAWKALHDKKECKKLGGNVSTHFTQGGLNLFTMNGSDNSAPDRALNQGREGFYGWMGLGGSIFQWHPEKQIGFAFVPTSLHVIDLFNERGKVYQKAILQCIENN